MRIVTVILALLFALPVAAQQPLTYYRVDSLSYAYYIIKDAKNLRKIANEASAAGIDYYYLRMRAGIVHYNKGNYEEAAYQFDKALNFFPIDTLAAEYLYFSYANTGRSFDANHAAKKLNSLQKQRYGIKPKPVQSISIGGGYAFSNNQTQTGSAQLWQNDLIYTDAYMLNNTAFGQIGMVNSISKSIKLFTSYSYYNLQNAHRYQDQFKDTTGNYTTTQYDFYLSPTFYLGKGFSLSPAMHYIQYGFNTYYKFYYPNPPGIPVIGTFTTKQTLLYGGLDVSYRFKYAGVSLSGGYSKLDSLSFYHGNVGVVYYPLGNSKLYGISNLLYLNDENDTYFAFTQKAGLKLFKSCWAEAGFATGKLRYFAEGNGYTIYTTPDEITMKLSATLNFYISKKVGLSAGYVYLKRQGQYTRSAGYLNESSATTNYSNHLITTTLTITP